MGTINWEQAQREGRNTKQIAQVTSKKAPPSLSLFSEVNDLNVEHKLSIAATVFWAKNCWDSRCTKKWDNDMFLAWKRHIFEATNWNKVQEACGCRSP